MSNQHNNTSDNATGNSPINNSHISEYTLDKSYFEECYSQSVDQAIRLKDFTKAAIFSLIGLGVLIAVQLIHSEESGTQYANAQLYYLCYFFIGLGVVEALQVKFKKTWWLWRQIISKAAGESVTLTIDEQGVKSESVHVKQHILWTEVYRVTQTEAGFLIHLKSGNTYLSKRGLSTEAIAFVNSKQAV